VRGLDDDLVFPSDLRDTDDHPFPLSNMSMLMCLRRSVGKARATVHGFRSSFRDWCADSNVPFEVAEVALAHKVGNTVTRAYFRSDIIERRREVMTAWADHCQPSGGVGKNVVPIKKR